MNKQEKLEAVPLYERVTLTLEEASAYTGVGIGTLRQLADYDDGQLVLWVGSKRMFKRRRLQEYLENAYSV